MGQRLDCAALVRDIEDIETAEQFDAAWTQAKPVDTVPSAQQLPPPDGWGPGDFPALSVAMIAYTANTALRPDPTISITTEGWMFIDVGNVRLGLPNRLEWAKLVHMANCTWNEHEVDQTPLTEGEIINDSADA